MKGAQVRGEGAGTWRLWIDTGGTFTDCVAVDPQGTEHRVKILSTSSLRGRVEEWLSPRQLRVSLPLDLPDGFFAGSTLAALGEDEEVAIESSSAEGLLCLAADSRLAAGAPCEIRSSEEAPVLAARVVTRTAAGSALPAISMRLATTRATNALLERSGAPTVVSVPNPPTESWV